MNSLTLTSMKVKVKHLDQLLDELVAKSGQTKDHAGLLAIGSSIDDIGDTYLYKNIYDKLKGRKENDLVGVGIFQLNKLAVFLGYASFEKFVQAKEQAVDSVLLHSVGNYYSYVRRNSHEGVIFKSPVRIQIIEGRGLFELKGPQWVYEGEVKLVNGCLFVLMRSAAGKEFHHVYKIGKREKPAVLQGIFSGVSTAFDPIGGTTVLVRSEETFSAMKNGELVLQDLSQTGTELEKKLANYFKVWEKNNLRIQAVTTFTDADL